MANQEDSLVRQKEQCIEILLREGRRYLIMIENFYKNAKEESCEFQKILYVIDRYTRYKTKLMEDMQVLREIWDETDSEIDEETVEANEIVEEFRDEEVEDSLFEEQFYHCYDIVHRKNCLMKLEMLVSRMFNTDGTVTDFQQSIHSHFMNNLKDYCTRVQLFLNSNFIFADSRIVTSEKQQTVKNFEVKCKELQQLLFMITEKLRDNNV